MKRTFSSLKKVFLEIHSWVGVGIGARHYYGKLVPYEFGSTIPYKERSKREVEVQYPMTSTEARERNREEKERGNGDLFHYKKGDLTNGFISEAELCECAKRVWKTHFPDAIALLKGSSGTLDPRPVLDGPEEFMRQANEIVAECEKVDWWEGDESKMEALSKRWDALEKKFDKQKRGKE